MNAKDLIAEALNLPVEERVFVVDSLLGSLNHVDSEIDEQWKPVVRRRCEELSSGVVEPVSGKEVFERVWRRLQE